MQTLAVTIACYLLKLPLSLKNRTRLVSAILDRLNAVPLQSIINFRDDGALLVDGKSLTYEQAKALQESAKAMQDSYAREIVREQVAYIAGTRGVTEGDTPEKLYFYRAAMWSMLQEDELYRALAGQQELSTTDE